MHKYVIEGGYPVKGVIRASGNKNAALPCIAASLLTRSPVILKNVPEIEDVFVMFEIVKFLGGTVEKIGENEYKLHCKEVKNTQIPDELSAKIRASILFAGPLLSVCGNVSLSSPGGDVIGRRRLDTHFLALSELGARIETDGFLNFSTNKLVGKDIFLDEASVTATENAIMASVLADGKTILNNVACEPHVQDLCNMLCLMGAKIEGIGSNLLKIEGVKNLKGCTFTIGADYMEIGSFLGLAAVTKGDIRIERVKGQDMRPLKVAFGKLGISWSIEGDVLAFSSNKNLVVNTDVGGMIPKLDDAPWPGFPADLTSIMTVIATQAEGTVLIHEKMFESRMFFVDKLIGMGAKITLCDPHRAVVVGPNRLQAADLISPDVRAGMAMVLAACCASGVSIIRNVYQIERGYENIAERLQSIGIKIRREEV